MTKEEFITIVQRCGYGTKKSAKKYVEKNPKEEYDTRVGSQAVYTCCSETISPQKLLYCEAN